SDRGIGVPLRLIGGREVAVALCLSRVLGDVLLRLRDGRAGAAEDVEVREELVEPTARAGADAEEGERDREEHGEREVDVLRPAAQAHEEELLVRVPARRML